MDYTVGVDIGTTQTKAVAFSPTGEVVAQAYKGYPMIQQDVGMAEQDPDVIFSAVVTCLRQVIEDCQKRKGAVVCVSFSTAMHSLIVLDKNKKRLTRCITWADIRSYEIVEKIKKEMQGYYGLTGLPPHAMAPFFKLVWLKEVYPQYIQEDYFYIGIKEYIIEKFFGKLVTDYGSASGTGLFHLTSGKWELSILERVGLSKSQFPNVADPTFQLGKLGKQWCKILGLKSSPIFVLGSGDGMLSNLGLGAVEKGVAALTIGTSGAFRYVVEQPMLHPQGETFCYRMDHNHWVMGGATSNGCCIIDWARQQFLQKEQAEAVFNGKNPYDYLFDCIQQVPIGANGLIFQPYLLGERAPLWNSLASGSFVGLRVEHSEKEMMRSIIEGVSLNLYRIFHHLQQLGGNVKEIRATGGFIRSKVWKQMMADLLGRTLTIPIANESSCFGAAFYGWKSMGWVKEIEEISSFVGIMETILPDMERHKEYMKIYEVFLEVECALSPLYENLAHIKKK